MLPTGWVSMGGDWGWVKPRETLRVELAEAALALKPSEVSDVVETERELYLLKCEGRRSQGRASSCFQTVR